MNEQADPLGRIAIQEQAPQASGKAKNKHKLTKFTYYRTP
jgi:hypothetical protein